MSSVHEWIYLHRNDDWGDEVQWCSNCGTVKITTFYEFHFPNIEYKTSMYHPKLPGAKVSEQPLCIGEQEQDAKQ
jgi:hypothetical protein